jgi:hypothetical protein
MGEVDLLRSFQITVAALPRAKHCQVCTERVLEAAVFMVREKLSLAERRYFH